MAYSKTFDITEDCIAYMRASISGMPGNAGQETLVKNLEIDGFCYITYTVDDFEVSAEATYEWKITSSHPEAIEIIIKEAYSRGEEIAKRAETILPVSSPDKWIIAGWNE
jgi:hypothetical protein